MEGNKIHETAYRFKTICWVVIIVWQSTVAANDPEEVKIALRGDGDGFSGSGSGDFGIELPIPTCSVDNEFLTSDGQRLLCRRIPPCTCFVGGEEPTPNGSVPLPPTGCPVYEPPLRGAITCFLNTTAPLMYCTVYCDHNFEFLSTPVNPYSCGPSTNFAWVDATERQISEFPECTAHRIVPGTIHSLLNYLPSPCYGLTDHTIVVIMREFEKMLEDIGVPSIPLEEIFMRCPSFDGRVYRYNEVLQRATHKREIENEN